MKLDVRQSYLQTDVSIPSVVHTQVTSLRLPERLCCHLLIDMDLFHEQEALVLGKSRATSAEPYQRKYLIVTKDWSDLVVFFARLSTAAHQKGFNNVLLKVDIQVLVGYLFPELNYHLSPNQLEDLVNPM